MAYGTHPIFIQDLFECLTIKKENKEAKSQFFRGYIAEDINQLYNRGVSVRLNAQQGR